MPRLRALKKKEDIEAVPTDQPVLIETASEEEEKSHGEEAQGGGEAAKSQPEEKQQGAAQEEEEITSLRQQLEELKKAERDRQAQSAALLEQERRKQQALQQEIAKHQTEAEQAQYDAIVSAIGQATSDAEAAQRDYAAAIADGDVVKQAEAQRKMARAEARLDRLEEGKELFEAQRETRKTAPQQQRNEPPVDPFEASIANLPDQAKTWLRKHPEFMTDQRKNAKIQALHWDVVEAGHEAFSPAYFEAMEVQLGMRQPPKKTDNTDDEAPIVSAPVSREPPSTVSGRPVNTRVTLTPSEREAAKLAGIDEVTYAKNKLKLAQLKKDGHYTEGR